MKKVLKMLTVAVLGLVAVIFCVAAFGRFAPKGVANVSVGGWQLRSQIWSGTIRVVGDVVFAPWLKLTVEPGAQVLFDKKLDVQPGNWTKHADAYIKDHDDPTGREGYSKSHFELTGKILAIGTKDRPIIFTSAQAKPEYADWDQIVALGGSRFEYIELAYGHNGLNLSGKNVTIKNSKIHDSLWSCVDIFATGNTIENNEIYHCWHQAVGVKVAGANSVKNNFIHDAQLSVNCENGAKPTIENNRFEAAPINPDCPKGINDNENPRRPDTAGGMYNGQLIYPSR